MRTILTVSSSLGYAVIEAGGARKFEGSLGPLTKLGGGLFGDVFSAQWTSSNGQTRLVAVKYLRGVNMRSSSEEDIAERIEKVLSFPKMYKSQSG